MSDVFDFSPIIAGKAKSPLLSVSNGGTYPTTDGAIGVTVREIFGRAICEVAAWPDQVETVRALIPHKAIAFEYAPARWVVVSDDDKMPKTVERGVDDHGSVVDLSHGRTVLRIRGKKVVWVLSKLFAIDFPIMGEKSGLATSHHGITAQIWREDENTFDIIIFRSFAKSFWHTLTKACADVGYAVE